MEGQKALKFYQKDLKKKINLSLMGLEREQVIYERILIFG